MSPPPIRLRARLVLLLLVLLPLNAYWVIQSEVIRYAGHPTTTSLFYNCVFWLFLLVGANGVLTRFTPRAAFARWELLAVYIALQITSALGSHDICEVLLPILAKPFHDADAANSWAEVLLPRLPHYLFVTDKGALDAFYQGHDSLYRAENWRAWAVPIAFWTAFLGTLTSVMLCLNVLLRKQWTEREKLPFPLIALPLEMTAGPRAPMFREPLLWAGFVGAAGLQLWNGLAFLIPTIPAITVKYVDLGPNFTTRPWNAIGWLPVSFYPFAIALGVLLPTDFLFSSWLFFWFFKMEAVVSAALAWDRTPNFPFPNEQALGGFFAVTVSVLWAGKSHLKRIADALFDGDHSDDADSPISYRAAALGALLGIGLLFAFCWTAGMTPWVIGAFFLIYFAITLAVTRMRAELGPPVHDLHHSGPDSILPSVLGPTNIPRQDLVMFGPLAGFNRAYRALPMPVQLEGFKMAEQARMPTRTLFYLMLVCGFVGPLCAFWALLHLGYINGVSSGAIAPPNVMAVFAAEPWNRFTNQVRVPQPPQPQAGMAIAVGFFFCLILSALRLRIVGFPLHPVGYAIASSWGMSVLWMPMLIAWAIKLLVLRYGGLGLYRRILPLVYGVILGECVAGSLWSLFGIATGIPTYAFWP